MLLQYSRLTVALLFLVVCTLLILFSNPISQSLDSTIAFSFQQSSYYVSDSIVSSSISNSKLPSSLSSDRINNDTILVLAGSTLIDGTGDPPKQNAVIIINGNSIIAVTNETEYHDQYHLLVNNEITKVNVLNLTGKYVIPGLFDMHAHVAGVRKDSYNQNLSENMLDILLDYGVTTIRNPGGPTNQSIALKHNVSEGTIQGPQIFTAGALLNGPQIPIPFVEEQISSEEEAQEEVRNQAAAGVDFVKLYVGLPPNLVKAAIDEAHTQGIKVMGHLYMTSWTDAANFGIDALAHGVPVDPFLLSVDDNKRDTFFENRGGPFDHFLWLDLVDLNSTEIKGMINSLVENDIAVDPTLSVYETMLKDIRYDGGFSDPQNQLRWTKVLQLTKIMYDNGIQILSGSDIPNFGLVPGASLHHELELLVEAGIKPLEVIKIATYNGANALGINEIAGTVQSGKQADMIVLSANPIQNISNTKEIEAVMIDGRFVNIDSQSLID